MHLHEILDELQTADPAGRVDAELIRVVAVLRQLEDVAAVPVDPVVGVVEVPGVEEEAVLVPLRQPLGRGDQTRPGLRRPRDHALVVEEEVGLAREREAVERPLVRGRGDADLGVQVACDRESPRLCRKHPRCHHSAEVVVRELDDVRSLAGAGREPELVHRLLHVTRVDDGVSGLSRPLLGDTVQRSPLLGRADEVVHKVIVLPLLGAACDDPAEIPATRATTRATTTAVRPPRAVFLRIRFLLQEFIHRLPWNNVSRR